MDRNELFDRLMQLEQNVTMIQDNMQALKALTVELVEENVALQTENDNLKSLLQQQTVPEQETSKTKSGQQSNCKVVNISQSYTMKDFTFVMTSSGNIEKVKTAFFV